MPGVVHDRSRCRTTPPITAMGTTPLPTKGTVRILQTAALVSSLDRAAIAPLLVPIAASFHRSVDEVTLAATLYLLAYGVMQLLWAAGSDRFGRVRTMRVSLLIAGIAAIGSAAAPSLPLLIASRGIAGAAFAAAVPAALVYIGDTVPIKVRPAALADLATGIAAGFALGTLGAAVLSDHLHWRFAFVITGASALALAVLTRRIPEPHRTPTPGILARVPQLVRHPGTILVLVLGFVEGFIVLGFLVFLPATLQLTGVSTATAGAVTAVYGLAVILTAWGIKLTAGRVPPPLVIASGGCLVVIAFGLLTAAQTPVTVMIAAACLGASWAQLHTALQAWATEVSPTSRALVVSAFATVLFTGSAVGTWAGGLLLTGGSLTTLFGSATALAATLAVTATIGRAQQTF